jgi:type IV secretion system protein TrbL
MFDLGCQAETWFESLVDQVAAGAGELVVTMSSWWVETDSVNVFDPAVTAAQDAAAPVIAVILIGSVLVQAIRMIISRRGEPLVLVLTGLIRYAATSAMGLVLLQTALAAGDELSTVLLDNAAERFAFFMRDALIAGGGGGPFVVLLVSVIAAVLAIVQFVLMAIRQAGLLVLAAMLPLAASGSLTKSTRGWLDRLIPWLIALVCYKPAAALIYFIGFSYVSTENAETPGTVGTALTGLMVLTLAVVAMPVMLKFFAWSGIQVGGASNGSGVLGAAGAAAMARSYQGSLAVQRAQAIDTAGPGSRAAPPGAAPVSGSRTGVPAGGGARLAGVAGQSAGAAGAVAVAGSAIARNAANRMASRPGSDGNGQQ